ncbi:hypothetical protein HWV62_26422 [Athelia sp. TMB]|nr:hypothetical protein HWV62_26422 [Athelia sp. TMB]
MEWPDVTPAIDTVSFKYPIVPNSHIYHVRDYLAERDALSSAQNFCTQSTRYSSRAALKSKLKDKLHFDAPRVLQRLGVTDIHADVVSACQATCRTHPQLQSIVLELDGVITSNESKGGKVTESAMYSPLLKIINFIGCFDCAASYPYDRHWVNIKDAKVGQGVDFRVKEVSPDLQMVEPSQQYPQTLRHLKPLKPLEATHYWRGMICWGEIKPLYQDGPQPHDPTNSVPEDIVTQTADYARHHLSARPFLLFSVGLLIFGGHFCIGIYDREGIEFSPYSSLWDKALSPTGGKVISPDFIRVIRCHTHSATLVTLGLDPTVELLRGQEIEDWKSIAHAQGLPKSELEVVSDPTYRVGMGQGSHSWFTLGSPIWSSVSFPGRGTMIWKVWDSTSRKVLVLKNAWRPGGGLSESTIYLSIHNSHPGLAKFIFGADVAFATGGTKWPINACRLRNPNLWRAEEAEKAQTDKATVEVVQDGELQNANAQDKDDRDEAQYNEESPVLHRLVLEPIGRPLWQGGTELDIIEAFCATIEGHRFLTDQGILHRNISAGNTMLSVKENPRLGEGFLTDPEFAFIDRPAVTTEEPVGDDIRLSTVVAVERDAVMTVRLSSMTYPARRS